MKRRSFVGKSDYMDLNSHNSVHKNESKKYKCRSYHGLCRKCGCGIGIIVIILYFIIYYSHYITCKIHVGFCTPMHVYLKKLRTNYKPMTHDEYIMSMNMIHDEYQNNGDNICDFLSHFDNYNANPCSPKLKLGILLAQRHGGSNWLLDIISQYKYIIIEREKLLDWEQNNCNVYSSIVNTFNDQCNEHELIKNINMVYNNFYDRYNDKICIRNEKNVYYYFFKIQISQLSPKMFNYLVKYIYCNDIMIIHLIRQATISSFFSYQTQTIERLKTKDLNKILKKKNKLDKNEIIHSMEIDPYNAKNYIDSIDKNREYLSNLIKYFPKSIKYQIYYYEDLIGKYRNDYLYSLFAFIGIKNMNIINSIINKVNNTQREHSFPCYKKIENWFNIKSYLNNTLSYYACQKEFS